MLPSPKNRCEPWHALRGSSVAARRIVPPASAFGSGRGSCERPARAPTVTGNPETTTGSPPVTASHRGSGWESGSGGRRVSEGWNNQLSPEVFQHLPTSSNIFQHLPTRPSELSPGYSEDGGELLWGPRFEVHSHWIVWTATVRSLLRFVCCTKCFQLSCEPRINTSDLVRLWWVWWCVGVMQLFQPSFHHLKIHYPHPSTTLIASWSNLLNSLDEPRSPSVSL